MYRQNSWRRVNRNIAVSFSTSVSSANLVVAKIESRPCDFPNRGHLDGECDAMRFANWVDGCPQVWMRESVASESVSGCTIGSPTPQPLVQACVTVGTEWNDAYSRGRTRCGWSRFPRANFSAYSRDSIVGEDALLFPCCGVCEIVVGETRRVAIALAKAFRDREMHDRI